MKPILFSTDMVKAILEGRKTQTRRIIKRELDDRGLRWVFGWEDWHGRAIKCPYGHIGDVLWVRETFIHNPAEYDYSLSSTSPVFPAHTYYKADEISPGPGPWKPSIFMPREACRLFLEITDVRVERLQDISEGDAKAEGMLNCPIVGVIGNYGYLWQKINGPESWEANPWVWVVSFKRVDKPATF